MVLNKFSTGPLYRELIDVVRRMAVLAEYRESNIINHLERIRGYCYIMASKHGIPVREAEIISYACQLHDVGMIGLPDTVRLKSDNLTPYEWEVVKRHPLIGADILKDSQSVIMQAGEIVSLTHHERWDGSGYPRGLQGEDIPVSGRICALADVFDALTTERSYKVVIPVEDALNLINDAGGQLFDPQLVNVFTENFDEILKFRQNYL